MKNVLLNNSIIIDFLSEERLRKFEASKELYSLITSPENEKQCQFFISSSSLDNLEHVLFSELKKSLAIPNKNILKIVHLSIKDLLKKGIKIAKTPSYIELNYEDIEDSQIIASAIAIDGQVVTRDKGMLAIYPDRAVTAEQLLSELGNTNQSVNFIDLKKQYNHIHSRIEKNIDEVINSTSFIMGNKIAELEENLADFVGVKHCIAVSSGTDALLIAMMALGIKQGDEVITTPFTFIATGEMIALLGAKPVFVDIDPKTYNIDPKKIEQAITHKTKAIMPVSLYGQCADFDAINLIAVKHGLPVIEDACQSLGATYKGRQSCSLSTIGCTSFFPSKPLGAYGDAGACFTNDDSLAKIIREIRVHGQDRRYHHPRIGINGRMDTMQAGILLAKMDVFKCEVKERQIIGETYTKALTENNSIITPFIETYNTSVFAQYTILVENREQLQKHLNKNGVPTAVHYPVPLNKQPALQTNEFDLSVAETLSNKVMSLPMHPYLNDFEISGIANKLNQFF